MLIAFVALASAWNVVVPPYENLDELEHAEVVRHIAVTGRLPAHGSAEAAGYHVRQEASQPPLYHLLAAGWARLWRLPTAPHDPDPVPAAAVACGPTGTLYGKATWRHDPAAESFPWRDQILTLHGLRAFSTLLQVLTLVATWTLARRVFPRGPVPVLATILVAFNPQFLLVAAGVNNDNAITPLATWGLVLGYDLWDRGPQRWRPWALGVVSGLALLSKLSGLALVGVGGLALLVRLLERRTTLRDTLLQALPMVLLPAAIAAPWLARNLHLYGDLTALSPMLVLVGQRQAPMDWAEVRLMVLSYWGQLPCAFYPRAVYWPYLALTVGGLAGLALRARHLAHRQRRLLALCAVWFGVVVLAWVRWNTITYATGGRLLFPAIGALAVLLAAGWRGLHSRLARVWSVIVPVWALIVLMVGPAAAFAPPPVLSEPGPVPHAVDASFGPSIVLHGYDASIRTAPLACALASSAYCSPVLDLTLLWEAREPVDEDLTLVIQLVSPVPGETELRLNDNGWPGHGTLPTASWPVGRVIRDRYRLPLGPTHHPTQAWTLTVGFVNPETGERVPLTVGGAPAGDMASLAQLRVPGTVPPAPDRQGLASPVAFGGDPASGAIVLEDATVAPGTEDTTQITLSWRSEAAVDRDLVTFVHAYDRAGTLLATGDGPPQRGAFPTQLWEPGDRILSTHALTTAEGAATIAVGLYDPTSGERLPAARDGVPLADNAAIIWQATP